MLRHIQELPFALQPELYVSNQSPSLLKKQVFYIIKSKILLFLLNLLKIIFLK